MKIGLDLSILERPCPTGVERAWRCLVREVTAAPGEDRFVLYSRGALDLGIASLPRVIQPVALGGTDRTSLWRELRLAPALKQDGVDLLHSPVAAIPLRTSVPRVATVHELPWLRHPGVEGRGREVAHRIRVRIAAQVAAALVVPSEATATDLAAAHPSAKERIRVVPHGVDPFFLDRGAASAAGTAALAAAGLPAGTAFLLAVGALRPRKDVATLLDAHARYRAAGGDRLLALAGPGEPPAVLPEGVVALGFLEDGALRAAYRAADSLVYHSLNEGFGLPPLEAMAAGTPVVATAVGSVPEVVGGAALLVPPGDAAALAAAMGAVTGDGAVRGRLRAAGPPRAAEFPWAAAARRVREVWREVAERAAASKRG